MLVQHICVLHVALVTAADYMLLISRQINSKLTSCSVCCRHPHLGSLVYDLASH